VTADEFLRELALRAEIVQVVEMANDEDDETAREEALVIRLDPHDADEILSLTGIRVE
jgi:hypothetical protein